MADDIKFEDRSSEAREMAEVMCISSVGELTIFDEEVAVDKDLYDLITKMANNFADPFKVEVPLVRQGEEPGELSFHGPAGVDTPSKVFLQFRGKVAVIDDEETTDPQKVYQALQAWQQACTTTH